MKNTYICIQSFRLFKFCFDLLGNAADGLQQEEMLHDSRMAIYMVMRLCSTRYAAFVSSFSFKVRIVLNSSRMPFVTCIPCSAAKPESFNENLPTMKAKCLVLTIAWIDLVKWAPKPCLARAMRLKIRFQKCSTRKYEANLKAFRLFRPPCC